MLEEQLVFWVFTTIFGLLSIIKTLNRYWDAQVEAKSEQPQITSVKTRQNDEDEEEASKQARSSNMRRMFTVSDKCVDQIENFENNINSNTTESVDFKHLRHFRKTKKKHLVKSILNYSIAFNSSFMIVGGLTESYLYVGDQIFKKYFVS
jgi:hypothetical protein